VIGFGCHYGLPCLCISGGDAVQIGSGIVEIDLPIKRHKNLAHLYPRYARCHLYLPQNYRIIKVCPFDPTDYLNAETIKAMLKSE